MNNKKILVFDNYDSFTYNLVHLIEKIINDDIDVVRNDEVSLDYIEKYDKIVLSPGPGIPEDAGLLLPLIKRFAATKSILGVCLGHQAIGQAFGGDLINLKNVYHGVATNISRVKNTATHTKIKEDFLNNLPNDIKVGRYHSWVISNQNFPNELEITAVDENNLVMGLKHKIYDVQGVQFHPESILTPDGEIMMRNWLSY